MGISYDKFMSIAHVAHPLDLAETAAQSFLLLLLLLSLQCRAYYADETCCCPLLRVKMERYPKASCSQQFLYGWCLLISVNIVVAKGISRRDSRSFGDMAAIRALNILIM